MAATPKIVRQKAKEMTIKNKKDVENSTEGKAFNRQMKKKYGHKIKEHAARKLENQRLFKTSKK